MGKCLSRPHLERAGAIVHVHYKGLGQKPYGADHTAVKHAGIPSFVIGAEGRGIITEIGRKGKDFYTRRVDRSKPSKWKLSKGFQ